jgi:hypothetical protein
MLSFPKRFINIFVNNAEQVILIIVLLTMFRPMAGIGANFEHDLRKIIVLGINDKVSFSLKF